MGKGKVKRQSKDSKFGFGGKKKGSKKNNLKQTEAKKDKKAAGKAKVKAGKPGPKGGNKAKGGGGRKR